MLSPRVIHGKNAAAIQIIGTVLSLIQLVLAQNTGLVMIIVFIFFKRKKQTNKQNK